jgi:hypothetical protein
MAAGMAGRPVARQALLDFLVLGGKALAGGIVAALTFACAALVLATSAQASTVTLDEPKNVTITWADGTAPATVPVCARRGSEPWSAALTPTSAKTGVGALRARSKISSPMDEITRADTESTLHLMLGLLALAAAATVAVIGRTAA